MCRKSEKMTKDKILLYFALKYDGDFNKIYKAISEHEPINFNDYNRTISKLKHKYITMLDSRYPDYLKDKANPPIVLFYHGNIKLFENEFVEPKYAVLDSGNRFISTAYPVLDNPTHFVFDYVIMAESQKDLDFLIEHVNKKGVPLKNYDKVKENIKER